MEPLPDFGPLYTETNLNQFPVEPLNTASNLLFLAAAVYWAYQVKKQTNPSFQIFLKVGLPLLLVGYVGGTVYHATRSHYGWMLMDVLPIYFIGLLTSIYHWKLVDVPLWKIFLALMGLLVLPLSAMALMGPAVYNSPNTPTLGYTLLALAVVFPLFLDQQQRQWKEIKLFSVPLVLIGIALSFRALDSSLFVRTHIPTGTHWLWHTFGAATCHFLLRFMEARASDQG